MSKSPPLPELICQGPGLGGLYYQLLVPHNGQWIYTTIVWQPLKISLYDKIREAWERFGHYER